MNHDFLTANFDERRAAKNGSCWWLKRGVGGSRRVDYSIFGNADATFEEEPKHTEIK